MRSNRWQDHGLQPMQYGILHTSYRRSATQLHYAVHKDWSGIRLRSLAARTRSFPTSSRPGFLGATENCTGSSRHGECAFCFFILLLTSHYQSSTWKWFQSTALLVSLVIPSCLIPFVCFTALRAKCDSPPTCSPLHI